MIQPSNWSPLHRVKQGLSPCRDAEACPGPSPAARRFDWRSTSPPNTFAGRRRAFLFESSAPFSSRELTGQTMIQVDFEWTSEGTDEFLGHEAEIVLRPKSPDRCLVQTQSTSLKPVE